MHRGFKHFMVIDMLTKDVHCKQQQALDIMVNFGSRTDVTICAGVHHWVAGGTHSPMI